MDKSWSLPPFSEHRHLTVVHHTFAMLLTIVPYAFLCGYFPLHLVAAAPAVSSSNSSHYVPPPPGGLTENPPTYQPKSPFDFQSIVCHLFITYPFSPSCLLYIYHGAL